MNKTGVFGHRRFPWVDWEEWRQLRDDLWSEQSERREQGLAKIRDWNLVDTVPIEVEVTAGLVKAKHVAEMTDVDPDILEALLAVPIIRLTAALRDQEKDLMLRPGSELPTAVGLARNDFVHGKKPSLEHRQCVCEVAMPFIKTAYWDFVEASLPTKETLFQAIQSYASCHERMINAGDVVNREDMEKMDEEIYFIQRACNGDQLQSFLLDHVPPPSVDTSAGHGWQNSLIGFCDSYGSSWLVYLAESWLERALLCVKWEVDADSVQRSSILVSWGAIIRTVLPLQSTVLYAVEQERIMHKVVELVEGVAAWRPASSTDTRISILEIAESIFNLILKNVHRQETKERLSAIFDSLKQQCFLSQSSSPSKTETFNKPKSVDEDRCGLFTRVRNWESCAIGCLPYNTKP